MWAAIAKGRMNPGMYPAMVPKSAREVGRRTASLVTNLRRMTMNGRLQDIFQQLRTVFDGKPPHPFVEVTFGGLAYSTHDTISEVCDVGGHSQDASHARD